MKPTLTLLTALLLAPLALRAETPPQTIRETLVWTTGESGAEAPNIPGVCQSRSGTLLAFCEGRIRSGDADPHHLLLKRSTDQGATWSESLFVERSEHGECYGNPTPVVDRNSGRVLLFYARNVGSERTQLFLRTSDDDGLTWTDRVDLTHLFDADPLKRPFHLPGPGHGTQLRSGRLVLPVWHRFPLWEKPGEKLPVPERGYAISLVSSDDGGKTWRNGGFTTQELALNESRVVELANGDLLLSARSTDLGKSRVKPLLMRSSDMGATWCKEDGGDVFPKATPCDASLLRLTHGIAADQDRLLFSWPNHPAKRMNMTVALSRDGGRTWPVRRKIHDGAGYSDLVELDNGSIGLLYQRGRKIWFARFHLGWLEQS